MRLLRLSLTNFRAFTRLDMEVDKAIHLVVGGNAQGKTSILEAIYYLATFTSLHAQHDRQLINYLTTQENLAVGRIVADLERAGKQQRIEVRLILEKNFNGSGRFRKEILLDGVKKSVQEVLGTFNAVIFLPQMTRIIEDGPEDRRRFLNLFIAQAAPGYGAQLTEYHQVVTQRNALLKQIYERRSDANQLEYWDELLVSRGAAIIQARIQAVHELEQYSAAIHQQLTQTAEVLRLEYRPSLNPLGASKGLDAQNDQWNLPIDSRDAWLALSVDEIKSAFKQQLRACRAEEIGRGVTTLGPHRDELRVLANGIDLGVYGSRGQIRTALLSLKLGEVNWLHARSGQWPVLLLDEIMAELDLQRRADLLRHVTGYEQVFLTTTDLEPFAHELMNGHTVWEAKDGLVKVAPHPPNPLP
jgi:DNA replication and repair protein RecF